MDQLKQRFPRYGKLLALYPPGYRKEYAAQQLQTLADMLDDPAHSPGTIWARTLLDLPFSIIKQQLAFAGGIMRTDMPLFVKRNALICVLLLLPFFTALIANGLDKLFNDHTLYSSWLWATPALAIWVLWLPLVAACLGLLSLGLLIAQRARTNHTSWWRQLWSFHTNWPLLAASLVSLGILGIALFHDSVHCVTGNPVREARNTSQTWHCIQQR